MAFLLRLAPIHSTSSACDHSHRLPRSETVEPSYVKTLLTAGSLLTAQEKEEEGNKTTNKITKNNRKKRQRRRRGRRTASQTMGYPSQSEKSRCSLREM